MASLSGSSAVSAAVAAVEWACWVVLLAAAGLTALELARWAAAAYAAADRRRPPAGHVDQPPGCVVLGPRPRPYDQEKDADA